MEENVTRINGRITINVDMSVKNVVCVKKIIFGILLHVVVKMKNIELVLWMIQWLCVMKLQSRKTKKEKTISTNFNKKNSACKTQSFYILLVFLLITIVLLTALSIYCYFIKYRAKQKHSLPYHNTNNELKEVIY